MLDLLEDIIDCLKHHIGSTYSDTSKEDEELLERVIKFRDNLPESENQRLGQSTII